MALNPAIAGIGVLGASAVVGGGLAVGGALNEASVEGTISVKTNPELKIESYEPHDWFVLVDDSKYDKSNTHKDKYGNKYELHLVGIDERKINKKLNDRWWKWSYKHSYRLDATEGFSRTIISGWQKLKDACREAYKGTLEESTGIITFGSNKYKEEEVWEFCTWQHQKPVSVSDNDGYASGTIGAGSNKLKLASTKDPRNHRFWDTRAYYFLRSNQKAPDANQEKFFKKIYDREKPKWSWNGYDVLFLMKECEKAYHMSSSNTPSSDTAPTESEVLKYCSMEDKYHSPTS